MAMQFRKLAEIQTELQQNLDAVYEIDSDLVSNVFKYTRQEILNKKKDLPILQKNIERLNNLINSGQYLEYQQEDLL